MNDTNTGELTPLKFRYNWNNKLTCSVYTTIRIRNDKKYQEGMTVKVYLNGRPMHKATVVKIKHFHLPQLNIFMAGIDTGYTLEEAVGIIKKMYPTTNFRVTQLSLILLKQDMTKPNDKIRMFCDAYKHYVTDAFGQGIKYKVRGNGSGKSDAELIADVEVTEMLLKTYFESRNPQFLAKYSIWNYVNNFNVLQAEHGKGDKARFPSYYSKKFEDKLQGKDRSEYWAHLRDCGFTPKKDQRGNIIDWVRE